MEGYLVLFALLGVLERGERTFIDTILPIANCCKLERVVRKSVVDGEVDLEGGKVYLWAQPDYAS